MQENLNIKSFVTKWQELYDAYMSKHFPNNPNPRMEITYGKKFAKVVREGSVEAFIDLATGDIFKPATWQKPAAHARGNVFSPENGLEALETKQYHPHVRYLR